MKLHHWFFLFLSFFAIAALIYSPSLSGPFQYDDYAQILDNKVLTGRPLPKLLSSIFRFTAHPDGWTGTRDFVRATFLLNWQWWGEKPLGYRWVNLTIHVINALLVAVLVSLLLDQGPRAKGQGPKESVPASPLAFSPYPLALPALAGLLFLVHPLNSQAVAYVAQRFTSVATLFYLLTVILWLEGCEPSKHRPKVRNLPTYLAAIATALLAFNSKEIAVTLPVALLLVSLALRPRAKVSPLALSLWPLALFFLLALKIPLQTATASAAGASAEAAASSSSPLKIDFGAFALRQKEDLLSRRDYFLTQISVIGTYLRLAALPVSQTLDYDYPISRNLDPKTLGLAALHLSLIGVGGWLLLGPRAKGQGPRESVPAPPLAFSPYPLALRFAGLGLLWFYLTLLPESSIIPIPDVIYEHRAYLPLVGLIIAAAALSAGWLRHCEARQRRAAAIPSRWLLVAGCLLLSIATLRRAYIWGNEVRLWADVYAKAPQKPRAVKNYGVVLAASGKYDDGIKLLEKAVQLDSDNADYWSNLGTANLRAGRFDSAKDKFLKAYELLAVELGLPPYGRLRTFQDETQGSQPSDLPEKSRRQAAQYLNDYGVCLVQLGRGEEALAAFQKSLAIDPTLYAARLGLGAAYNLQNNIQAATDVFETLVEEYPDLPDAYNNLAVMYKKAGRLADHDRILRAAPKTSKTP